MTSTKTKTLVKELNKLLGADTVKVGSDVSFQRKYWSTGIHPVDVLAKGGLPAGRIISFYGDSASAKSWVAYKAIASVQAQGGSCALVDTEGAWSDDWGKELGINTEELLVQRPKTAEEAVTLVDALTRSGFDLIVWDSITASMPAELLEKKPGEDNKPARLAAVMSKGLRRINSGNKKTCILCISQTRSSVGVVFGNPETVPGGKALTYYSSLTIRFGKYGRITEDVLTWDGEKDVKAKRMLAYKLKLACEKSRQGGAHRDITCTFDLVSGGVDELGFIIATGLEHGIIIKDKAAWSVTGHEFKARGKDKFRQNLADSPEMREHILKEIYAKEGIELPG